MLSSERQPLFPNSLVDSTEDLHPKTLAWATRSAERATKRGWVYDWDNFPTIAEIAQFALTEYAENEMGNPKRILDVGAGKGIWAREARRLWPDAIIHGVDIRDISKASIRPGIFNEYWTNTDFLLMEANDPYDLAIGNPPFGIAEDIVLHALSLLAPGGSVFFLLRLAFLAGKGRHARLYQKFPIRSFHTLVQRPTFTESGGSDQKTEYMVARWSLDSEGKPWVNRRSGIFFMDWR